MVTLAARPLVAEPPARSDREVDIAALAGVAQGDPRALEMLYDRYARLVLSFALRIVGDRPAAEEVVQEVFIRVWQRAGFYQPGRGAPVTWLLSITHNLAIDEVRRRRRRPQTADGEDPGLALANAADPAPNVEDEVWLRDVGATLASAMARLPPAQRVAIELAYFRGLSQREIARELGDPLGTVKTRLRLGLRKLELELGADAGPGL